MQRRKFLIGAGGTVIGASALIGSGAFTRVQAERDLEITVADDAEALLQITRTENSPNADEYVSVSGGTIGIETDGVNRDATTVVRSLFDIKNGGPQNVLVWIDGIPDGVGFFADNFNSSPAERPDVGMRADGQPGTPPLGHPVPSSLYLLPGESLSDVGFFVTNTTALEADDTDSITIVAATPDEVYFENLGGYENVEDFDNAEDDPDFDEADLLDVNWRNS